ncbi:MAG TPA: ABC transporter permease [Methylomusa anaerophila]|uniref:Putative aliphatic sulfonates transport permease protein SsuC n=1 Tax=Methylomusa anaerophila TaxID=1930071 RepID=A0A348AEL4_9FIRM|nr:ABC transporter permease [Methylomusa anaerophila]BBB89512.1 putative aliphatic sulfonates transport permease protein SsuC [Methylomusa anaerophila]HML90118.1 ABC transporter permease [Methylomusa anaerophila]
MKESQNSFIEWLIDVSGIIAFFLLWEIAPRIGLVDAQFIPPLSEVLLAAGKLAANGDLFIHIAASLQRTFIGLALAVALAVPLGFLLGGVFPALGRHMQPLLRLLGQVNAFSLFPIFILFFGIGEVAKVSIIFWSSIWPVLFTTIAGIQQVDPLYIKSARSMGADRMTIFRKVILPGTAPVIFTGVRTGASHAFLMLIAAEMIGASAGLGWVIHNSAMNNIIPRLFAATITIALLGMAINYLLHWLEESVVDWRQDSETST